MLPLRERGTSHPRSVVLGIARQQASAKVSICSMTGPRLVARDRWFESISLQRRVACEPELSGVQRYTEPPQPPQNCLVASLAPSAIAASFAHTTSGSTAAWPTQVPKPQSLPAMTLSRPTRLA